MTNTCYGPTITLLSNKSSTAPKITNTAIATQFTNLVKRKSHVDTSEATKIPTVTLTTADTPTPAHESKTEEGI